HTSQSLACPDVFFLTMLRTPRTTLFPYTTLFRSSGGMANVYKAEDPETGLIVALKVLTHESASQPKRLERFRREARQGARLRHRSEEHTSELQSPYDLVCRLLLEKKNNTKKQTTS